MRLCYAGASAPSAQRIADNDDDIFAVRSNEGDINWGRARANTRLNPDISNATNKRRMRELFAEHKVPMPKLLTKGHTVLDLGSWGVGEWQYPIVGRPDTHSRGRGLWLCNNFRDVERAIRGTRRKKAATHFMEWIVAPHEYRVHVFLGKSIRISQKLFRADGTYTTGKPEHNIKHVRKAAKKAVKALGLDFGCVDVLANDDECWVLEVNAAPGCGGTVPKLYAQVFKEWENGEWDEG